MTLTLAQARTRVRMFVDDRTTEEDEQKWSDAEIDAALTSALHEVMALSVSAGVDVFSVTGTFTSSALGAVDLTAVRPLAITRVQIVDGAYRRDVSPARTGDILSHEERSESLVVSYVPSPTLPAAPGDAFVLGSSAVSIPTVETLMCLYAASELKINEGELLAPLQKRIADLERAVREQGVIPSWVPMRLPGVWGFWPQPLSWARTGPGTLQLVRT